MRSTKLGNSWSTLKLSSFYQDLCNSILHMLWNGPTKSAVNCLRGWLTRSVLVAGIMPKLSGHLVPSLSTPSQVSASGVCRVASYYRWKREGGQHAHCFATQHSTPWVVSASPAPVHAWQYLLKKQCLISLSILTHSPFRLEPLRHRFGLTLGCPAPKQLYSPTVGTKYSLRQCANMRILEV